MNYSKQTPKKVEITKYCIRILSAEEDFFIPLSQVVGVVYTEKLDKLEVHNINKEMTVTFRNCPNLKDYFEQIISCMFEMMGRSEFKISESDIIGGAVQVK